jgi:hypothetical protein
MTAMTTLRLLAVVAALAGIVLVALACGQASRPGPTAPSTTTGTSRAARTQVDAFVAWLDGSRLSLPLAGRAEGACFTPSIAAWERADAWRCAAGGEIHDPCFIDTSAAPPSPGRPAPVACPRFTTPASGGPATLAGAFVVDIADALPSPTGPPLPPPSGRPWAIELVEGPWCLAATGTVDEHDGAPTTYICFDGSAIVGDIDRSAPLWQAQRRRPGNGGNITWAVQRALT